MITIGHVYIPSRDWWAQASLKTYAVRSPALSTDDIGARVTSWTTWVMVRDTTARPRPDHVSTGMPRRGRALCDC